MSPADSPPPTVGALLDRLHNGFSRRHELVDDAEATRALDLALGRLLDQLSRDAGAAPPTQAAPLPREAAIAMVTALHAQPHLGSTFGLLERRATHQLSAPQAQWLPDGLFPSPDAIEAALGLVSWEVDDLREEVDRRAGWVFKQSTVISWLWNRARLGEQGEESDGALRLYRMLAPTRRTTIDKPAFIQAGAQLYVAVTQPSAAPLASLELPWLAHPDGELSPSAFRASWMDTTLRRALARGIGLDDDDTDALLEQAIVFVPRHAPQPFLAQDAWRADGLAALCGLSAGGADGRWLVRPIAPEEVPLSLLALRDGDTVRVHDPSKALLALAAPRLAALMRRLYAGVLATAARDHAKTDPYAQPGPVSRSVDALALFDVAAHVRAAMQPVLDWALAPATTRHLAAELGVSDASARDVLRRIHQHWTERVARWAPTASTGGPALRYTLALRLIQFDGQLRRVLSHPTPGRCDHRPLAVLYAAQLISEANLERLGIDGQASKPTSTPEDIVGRWFLPALRALLDAIEDDGAITGHVFLEDSP